MRKVDLSYSLSADATHGKGIQNSLVDLLLAVRSKGSISDAAQTLGFSYRHVWGELKRWDSQLGRPLIVWSRGQPAKLTPFAEKLLWAERLAQARVAPQIEALHAELERAFAVALQDDTEVQTLFASHDEALTLLRGFAAGRAKLHLDIRFCGSVDAISALNEGRCTVAGFHARWRPGKDTLTQRAYQPLLVPGEHKLIGFAQRSQGLMVAPGNPLNLHSLSDVVARDARFVNRSLGTGTRLLLDDLLAQAGIPATAIRSYDAIESSHNAVAQAIAADAADTGLGIEASARRHGLDFVPLAEERYYLVCLKAALDEPPTVLLRKVLQSAEWRAQIAALPGYLPWRSGEVLSLQRCMPWWELPHKRHKLAA